MEKFAGVAQEKGDFFPCHYVATTFRNYNYDYYTGNNSIITVRYNCTQHHRRDNIYMLVMLRVEPEDMTNSTHSMTIQRTTKVAIMMNLEKRNFLIFGFLVKY